MSFQGFQGTVDTSGGSTSPSAQAHLEETKRRIAAIKAAEEQKRLDAASRNLTSTGLVLDTNKPVIGGQSNITSLGFVIVGGKAIPKSALGSNIARSTPSILTRDGRRLTASSPNLTDAQKQALGIISGQQQATFNLAEKISAEQRAQQLSGKTIEEARKTTFGTDSSQFIAQPTTREGGFAFSTKDRNIVNSALQGDIIRSNAAKLSFADQLIKAQTDTNRGLEGRNATTELDDLQSLLDAAPNQDAPINTINVQGDEFGNLVSPRNVKLQVENALLSGGLTQPQLNIIGSQGTMPEIAQIEQAIAESLANVTDSAQVSGLTSVSQLPDGTLQVDFSEEAPEIFRQQFGDSIFEALGQFFDLKDQGVDDFFQNPEGLRIKIGEEEIGLGAGGGGAGGLLDEQGSGFDILGLITNPIVLIAVAAIAGLVIFTKVRK